MEKNLKVMGAINLLNEIKLYGIIAILYYIQLSGSMALGMSVFSITTIVAALTELPTGIVSDRIGRKNTVIIGSVCSLISVLLLFLSKNYFGLLISAAIQGLEKSFFSGNNNAFIYDILKEEGREKEFNTYIGKTNSMFYLAGVISAILGTFLVGITSYRFVIGLSVIPKIFQLIASFMLKETKKYSDEEENIFSQTKNSIKEVMKSKVLKKQIVADGIIGSVEEACFQFRSTFYEMVWPTWALGIPAILANIGAFSSNWFGGKILKKFGNKKVILFSNIYDIFSGCLAVLMNNVFSPIVMVTNSVIPADIAEEEIGQNLYKDEYRASMASVKAFFGSLMFSIIAVLVGVVADKIGVIYTFVVFQLVKIVPIIIYQSIFYDLEERNLSKINS